jgi:hypothetical protein
MKVKKTNTYEGAIIADRCDTIIAQTWESALNATVEGLAFVYASYDECKNGFIDNLALYFAAANVIEPGKIGSRDECDEALFTELKERFPRSKAVAFEGGGMVELRPI